MRQCSRAAVRDYYLEKSRNEDVYGSLISIRKQKDLTDGVLQHSNIYSGTLCEFWTKRLIEAVKKGKFSRP